MFESDARGGGKKEVFVLVGQCLDVASEVIENRLPALALLLDRMGRFAVECNAHFDTRLTWGELDLGLTITESRRCAASPSSVINSRRLRSSMGLPSRNPLCQLTAGSGCPESARRSLG